MSERDDGGPAFPVPHPGLRPGMSLRDHFAAQAMQGTLAGDANARQLNAMIDKRGISNALERMAHACYLIADAMLAERQR